MEMKCRQIYKDQSTQSYRRWFCSCNKWSDQFKSVKIKWKDKYIDTTLLEEKTEKEKKAQ